MKKKIILLLIAAVGFLATAQAQNKTGSEKEAVVYFTRDVSSEGLMKVYNALNQKITGKVGIKVSFGGPDEQVLNPELLRGLVSKTGGTMFDGNGLSGNRWTAEMNLKYAKDHGFTAVGKCIMMSETEPINLPPCSACVLTIFPPLMETSRTSRSAWQTEAESAFYIQAERTKTTITTLSLTL